MELDIPEKPSRRCKMTPEDHPLPWDYMGLTDKTPIGKHLEYNIQNL